MGCYGYSSKEYTIVNPSEYGFGLIRPVYEITIDLNKLESL
jgi:hypothetical protein